MNYKKFVHPDSDGKPWGIASAEQLWAHVYALKYNRPEKRLPSTIWRRLFQQAKDAAIEFGAERIEVRIRLEYEADLFKRIFAELGLEKKSGRIEYQSPVEKLPSEEGSPFVWKTAKDLHWDTLQIAEFTRQILQDSLDLNLNEPPEDFIQDCLYHDEYTSGPECIGIGFIDGQACGLSIVQIEPKTGWSRITYMGLLPAMRGKGLGKWVHRHGFAMIKHQGGRLYHGGTHVDNTAMRKLFEAHNCPVFCEMEEWSFDLKGVGL